MNSIAAGGGIYDALDQYGLDLDELVHEVGARRRGAERAWASISEAVGSASAAALDAHSEHVLRTCAEQWGGRVGREVVSALAGGRLGERSQGDPAAYGFIGAWGERSSEAGRAAAEMRAAAASHTRRRAS